MYKKIFLIFVIIFFQDIQCLIVPDEVPSLLSLVYSNIPPIKKGTDSRLGWGFRLGEHADFQILVELGPQSNTKPLGNDNNNNNKRNTKNNLRDTLYAQNQVLKKERERQQQTNEQDQQTDASKWLKNWSEAIRQQQAVQSEPPMFGIGEIDASKVLPEIPEELENIYGRKSKNIQKIALDNIATTTEKTENSTENNGATFLAKLARG